jgi:WD40 repeat protein
VPLEGHRGDVLRLSFDPSSNFLASADGSEVIIWSAKDRTEVSRIPLPKGYATTSLAVSPEGRYIATSSSGGKTLLWDTTSNDLASTPLLVEGTTSLTFSPDGRWLSIGSQNEIRLWNLDTGKIDPRRIPIPRSGTIKFSPDSAHLAISRQDSNESEVTIWNVREAQIAGTVIVDLLGSGNAFAFTPDSARLAVAGQGVFLGPFGAPWALQHVCRITGRNLTPEEWNQHAQELDSIATCP